MKLCDARLQGVSLAGKRIAGHDASIRRNDPLVHLSDAFNAGALRGYSRYKQGSIAIESCADSELTFEPTAGGAGAGSWWYNTNDGILAYVPVDGDVRAILDCYARNSANNAPPPLATFKLAGFALHDPDRSDFDYCHAAFGGTNDADLRAEWKSTFASVSDPAGGDAPGYGSISWPSADGQLMLERVGQTVEVRVRAGTSGAWTSVRTLVRTSAPLPRRLQLGLMVYSSDVAHDIALHARSLIVSKP